MCTVMNYLGIYRCVLPRCHCCCCSCCCWENSCVDDMSDIGNSYISPNIGYGIRVGEEISEDSDKNVKHDEITI